MTSLVVTGSPNNTEMKMMKTVKFNDDDTMTKDETVSDEGDDSGKLSEDHDHDNDNGGGEDDDNESRASDDSEPFSDGDVSAPFSDGEEDDVDDDDDISVPYMDEDDDDDDDNEDEIAGFDEEEEKEEIPVALKQKAISRRRRHTINEAQSPIVGSSSSSSSKRNAGRSKISTGTKAYMKNYAESSSDGILRLGNVVPDFAAETTHGKMESFHQWKQGKWCVLFSHPADFTPVCTTEIASMAVKYPELKKRDCLLIGLSIDSAESHQEWMADILAHYDDGPSEDLDTSFPMIGDRDGKVAHLYCMLDESSSNTMTIRSVFIIDPEHRLRLNLNYPASVGRNSDEIVRCVKALQLSYQKSIATPVNWPHNHSCLKLEDGTVTNQYQGSVFLLPTVTTEQAFLNYPHYHTCQVPSKKKYLRLVQPEHVGMDPAELQATRLIPTVATQTQCAIPEKCQPKTEDASSSNKADASSSDTSTTPPDTTTKKEEGGWKWPWEDQSSKEENNEAKPQEPWTWPWEDNNNDNKEIEQSIKEEKQGEPWRWPWEGDDDNKDGKEANISNDDDESHQQAGDGKDADKEPFRWPWEQKPAVKEEKSNESDDTSATSNNHHQEQFRWPWEPKPKRMSEHPSLTSITLDEDPNNHNSNNHHDGKQYDGTFY